MQNYVLGFHEIDKSHLLEVGGKGANLGEMTQAGFPVPPGFCVTTWAFRTFVQTSTEIDELIDLLDGVRYDDLEHIGKLGQQIRDNLTSIPMPEDIQAAISHAWETTGQENAYAVRSSATAEDLPTASFAGQQDTYLNICGLEQLLQAVQKCWASLFTDRAISYRAKNGFNHRAVYLSVVVQQMVFPDVSGILFTADPITGHRNTLSIDASFGLGEALVSGLVTADLYQVLSDEIIKKQISKKAERSPGISRLKNKRCRLYPMIKFWNWRDGGRKSKLTTVRSKTSSGGLPTERFISCRAGPLRRYILYHPFRTINCMFLLILATSK